VDATRDELRILITAQEPTSDANLAVAAAAFVAAYLVLKGVEELVNQVHD